MIGSLLFYVLSPLSRYLRSRPSEASEKGPPPAAVDGEANRKFTESQTTMLDQRLSPSCGSKGETEERMKEQSSLQEDDKEQLMASMKAKTKNEADLNMSQVQPAAKQEEMQEAQLDTEDANVTVTEDISPEQAQVVSLQTEDDMQVTTCPETANIEEPVPPAEACVQYTTDPVQEQSAEELVTEAETAAEETECWDEYLGQNADVMCGGAGSSELFASLLDDTRNLSFNGQLNTQTDWHFPAETDESPLWQVPAVSYYPPAEPTVPFEVIWRVWEEVGESAAAAEPAVQPTKASMDFTVMSYNILAQDLLEANQELYTHCPLEVLDWSYRCCLLLQEIEKWAPDILCLQEVQENHYHEELHPVLTQMGYTCVYKRRTGTKTDGCATCYRGSCFSEISVTLLEFFKPDIELLDRHNVGIVLLLRPVVPQEVKVKDALLCVANTHLLFNPRRGDVKLAQLAIMLAEIHSVVKSCKAKGEHCNVILCGDFNSVPYMPLYQFITTGELYFQGLPAWMISGQEDLSHKAYCHRLFAPLWPSCLGIDDYCQYTTVTETYESQSYVSDASMRDQPYVRRFRHSLSHWLDLESVYKHILPGSGNSEVTTLHSEVGATVDYIFYSPKCSLAAAQKAGGDVSKGLKLIGCVSLLSEDVLWSMNGLPNHIFPSDHLSLLAKFQLDLNTA
ncbi:hypothetical protein PAMA_003720 [Pampus argenteus]